MSLKFGQKIIDAIRMKKKKNGNCKITINNPETRNKFVIDQLAKLEKGTKILDAGAGTQRYKKYCSHLIYESQDFCQYDGYGDGKALNGNDFDTSKIDIVSDITNIPREEKSYDAILSTEVIEHVPNPIDAIKEFSRLLKNNGILILTAPFCSLTHQSPYYFYNGFSLYWYREILEKFGFEIIFQEANGNYFDYFIQEINRFKYCQEKYSNKNIDFPTKSINDVLEYLQNCSRNQTNSEELLCFGWHIVAKKH